jgi:indole-3-glycerol phosphate synthase
LLSALAPSTSPNVKVIAEIKRKSPSKGWLAQNIDASAMASLYEAAGASAVSVLTDQLHFGARHDDLSTASRSTALPTLRKDFTVSENDVLDALEQGAAAILLIVALLSDDELVRFHELATSLGLDVLVEIHDHTEAARAVSCGARIIGVNQRNLTTFDVDPTHAAAVANQLPSDVVRVAESGLRTADDVARAAAAGFHAVLVGETFVTSPTPYDTVSAFASVPLHS